MKSKAYKYGGKLFRYDFDDCMVEYIVKANAEMRKDNEEWMEEFGKPMWEIYESGYSIIDRVGLRRENWKDKEQAVLRTVAEHGGRDQVVIYIEDRKAKKTLPPGQGIRADDTVIGLLSGICGVRNVVLQ